MRGSAALLFYGALAADAVLDASQSRVGLLVIWIVISGLLAWQALNRLTLDRGEGMITANDHRHYHGDP